MSESTPTTVARSSHNAVAALVGASGVFLLGAASLLLAASVAGILPSQSRTGEPQPQKEATATSDQPSPSEFALVQLGEFRRDQFLIDRRFGRVWGKVCSGEVSGPNCKGMEMWDEMFVRGVTPPSSLAALEYRLHLQEQLDGESKKAKPTTKGKQ